MHSTSRPERRRPAKKRDVDQVGARAQRSLRAPGLCRHFRRQQERFDSRRPNWRRALDGRVTFDGGSIDGFVRGEELDMLLQARSRDLRDVSRGRSSRRREARLICDIAMPDGMPFEGCPRTTLRRAVESRVRHCAVMQIGLEIEFYLFEQNAGRHGASTAHVRRRLVFRLSRRTIAAKKRAMPSLPRCSAMGVPIVSAHHEHGAGQHEIDFAHDEPWPPPISPDDAHDRQTRRARSLDWTRRSCPNRSKITPAAGLHVDFRFDAASGAKRRALYVVGGLLAHAPATTAICNSTVNSYKRLVAAWDAPIYTRVVGAQRQCARARSARAVAAAHRDAQPGPGVQSVSRARRADRRRRRRHRAQHAARTRACRLDLRIDRTTNAASAGSERCRKSLRQAIGELDADPVVRAALGDHMYHAFRDAKLAEYERYRRAVHPWEREQYLRTTIEAGGASRRKASHANSHVGALRAQVADREAQASSGRRFSYARRTGRRLR